MTIKPHPDYKRIATEEAFAPKEMFDIYRKILAGPNPDPGFVSLLGFYMTSQSERARHIIRCLADLDQIRLQHMDDTGIDRQVIALTSPGVQIMDTGTAVSFAKLANDQLAEAVKKHPTRFSGMVAIAPQDPKEAAKEIERGIGLGLTGVIVNSHTHGEYLSDQKFWDIFAAAEAADTPIYLHPNTPPRNMIQPFL
ncbi:MAG TPA: amidohydrolase family protein, partial [Herbaspirillum sp.]